MRKMRRRIRRWKEVNGNEEKNKKMEGGEWD